MSFFRTDVTPLDATEAVTVPSNQGLIDPAIPKILRNGTESIRLSVRALTGALFDVIDKEGTATPRECCEWLTAQVAATFKDEWDRRFAELIKANNGTYPPKTLR